MYKVGDFIRIIKMAGMPRYDGKEGVVERIDGIGQLHGSWGGCAVIPGIDEFEIITKEDEKLDKTKILSKVKLGLPLTKREKAYYLLFIKETKQKNTYTIKNEPKKETITVISNEQLGKTPDNIFDKIYLFNTKGDIK